VTILESRCDHPVTYSQQRKNRARMCEKHLAPRWKKLVDSHMPRTRAVRRYSIEIKEAEGPIVFSTVAFWDEEDKRLALAQIERLARLPEVNFCTGPALAPQSDKSEQRRRPRRNRPDRDV
jgi:hypothetical protein